MRSKGELIRDLTDACIYLAKMSEDCMGHDYYDEVDAIRDAIVYVGSDGNPPDDEEEQEES